MLKAAFRDNALHQTQTYEGFKHFKTGRYVSRWWWGAFWQHLTGTTIKNVETLRQALLEDRRRTIHGVCNNVGLSHGKCHSNLSDVWCIAAKFVPRLMSKDQKGYCIAIWNKIKEQPEKTLTSSATLLVMNLGYLGTTLRRHSNRLSGRLQLHYDWRKFGAMSNQCWFFFFDADGNVYKEFVLPLQAVKGKFCCNVPSQLTENIWRKRPDKWRNNSWALNHDNALAQVSLLVLLFFDYYKLDSHPPPSLLTRPHPVIILPIPEDEIDAQGLTFNRTEEIWSNYMTWWRR